MHLRIFYFLFSFMVVHSAAQTAPDKYWVQFTDKNNSPFSIYNPSEYLSEKCIARRVKFSLGFDERDIPVNETYISEVLNVGQCFLHQKSKWFNAITISFIDSALVDVVRALPFVWQVRNAVVVKGDGEIDKLKIERDDLVMKAAAPKICDGSEKYGASFRQIDMLNGHLLHTLDYTGKGVDIAQFDAGWNKTDQLPAFQKLRDEGRIRMTRDFVYHDNVYNLSNHGTFVLSTMAGIIQDSLIGTAPDANYFLFRTEDPQGEFLVEEDNWVAAAELSDSLGVDIINSSLGYSLFDDESMNHTYADMDGNTTRCSIAADIAAEKGILVVNSAGNSGNNPWHFITAPSDGDSVLCVGAVDASEMHANFSSFGPSSDGDIKPDVVTMGRATVFADLDSTITTGNGTSFSSPIMAGMAACLVQAFPEKSNMDVLNAIRSSADKFLTPNDSLGYGIPDLMKAFFLLAGKTSQPKGDFDAVVFPNPCRDHMTVLLLDGKYCETAYEIYDAAGKRVYENSGIFLSGNNGILQLDVALRSLKPGNYTLHLGRAGRHSVIHFQKMN